MYNCSTLRIFGRGSPQYNQIDVPTVMNVNEDVMCNVYIAPVMKNEVRDLWTNFLLLWALVVGPRGDGRPAVSNHQNVSCHIDLGPGFDVSLLGSFGACMAHGGKTGLSKLAR